MLIAGLIYANILTKNVSELHKINVFFICVGMHLEHETIKLSVWSISIFKLQNAAQDRYRNGINGLANRFIRFITHFSSPYYAF